MTTVNHGEKGEEETVYLFSFATFKTSDSLSTLRREENRMKFREIRKFIMLGWYCMTRLVLTLTPRGPGYPIDPIGPG